MLIHCPSCNAEYNCTPGRFQCKCGTQFSVTVDGSVSAILSTHRNLNRIPLSNSNSFDIDQTIPPRQNNKENSDLEVTMPGKRNRKPDGRFEIGDMILNRYKVLSELGQGGMGVVYKCFDEIAGIEIALKALPPELSHNSMEMEDVKENFQLVSRLIHQNIAVSKNLEKDNATGNYYLIMECVEGEDLRHWIRRKRKENMLTVENIVPVIKKVAAALDYAHEQKIIHRDIKPGNIMIDQAGHVKVLDFGLAAQIHTSMTRVSMAYHGTSGTAPYMAPEQWRGRAQGAPADQYALAVMTYEMLSGHLPFESADASVLREAVLNETAEPLQGVPAHAQKALNRAMSKNPADRFSSCSDFVTALSGGKVLAAKPREKSANKHSIVCPVCKKTNEPDVSFCVFCGERINMEETATSHVSAGKLDYETTIKRITILMEQQEWDKARGYCEKLLVSEPEDSELYLKLCMIGLKITNEEGLKKASCKLNNDKNFQFALRFASPERKKQLEEVQSKVLFNCYFTDFMQANRIKTQSEITHFPKPIIDDPLYQKALKVASEEQKRQLLEIQYAQAEYLLEQIQIKHKVKELIQVPVPLEIEKSFQTALRSASPERQKELLSIQQNQGEYFLKKCMEANHVTCLSELASCEKPLGEDQFFKTAILCSSPERQKELEKVQTEQSEIFLKKCMEENHVTKESDLSSSSVPLNMNHYFCLAIKYATSERKKELKKIQSNQSDLFLKKCLENHHVSDVSLLYRTKKRLSKDLDFKKAQECALPEQLKVLNGIRRKHSIHSIKRSIARCTIAVGVIVLVLMGSCIVLVQFEEARHAEEQRKQEEAARRNEERRLVEEQRKQEDAKRKADEDAFQQAVVLQERVARIKSELDRKNLDRGQTFGTQLDVFLMNKEKGDFFIKSHEGVYAIACFEIALSRAEWLTTNESLRKQARDLFAELDDKKRNAELNDAAMLTTTYQRAVDAERTAQETFESGDFHSAIRNLKNGIKGYQEAYSEARNNTVENYIRMAEQAKSQRDWDSVKKHANAIRPFDPNKADELDRIVETGKKQDEETKRKAEEARIAEEQRKLEEARAAEEQRKLEEARKRQKEIANNLAQARKARMEENWKTLSELAQKVLKEDRNNAEAQYYMGLCSEDNSEAVNWYRKAAEQGYAEAQYILGNRYCEGNGLKRDYAEAVKWLRKAAEQNHTKAKKYLEIAELHMKAQNGDNEAQYSLGRRYETGDEVTRKITEAVNWYRKAAEKGHARAQFNLGKCYETGNGITKNVTEAIKWYRKAAEQGYAEAQYQLGGCYETGIGVTKKYSEAATWYRKAAEQGHTKAQCELGNYERSTKNYSEALKWYRKAADKGNAEAQFKLGECYEKGYGVKYDVFEAEKWYRKAAKQGVVPAQDALKRLGHQ